MLLVIAVAILLFLPWGTIYTATVAAAKRFAPSVPSFNPLTVKVELPLWKVLVLIVAFWLVSNGGGLKLPDWKLPAIPGIPSFIQKATAVTYVYEKDQGGVPGAVLSGLNKLNERKILATSHEHDTTNGNQQVPLQYLIPVDAFKAAGGQSPVLVVQSGNRILKVTKDPKTEEDVLKGVP